MEGGGGGDGGRKTQRCQMITSQKLVTNLVKLVLLKKSRNGDTLGPVELIV